MQGVKHLVECHCVLPQFRERKIPVYHKFTVFSVIDKSDTVIPTYAQCNNCGTVHKIYDVCKSEIIAGKDESAVVEKKSDISVSLPSSLVELFESYGLETPDYQYARFIIENKMWDTIIVLTAENEGEARSGKILRFVSDEKFRVEPFTRQDYV
jgi:hypothetical protein